MATDPGSLLQTAFVDDATVTGTALFFVQTSASANTALTSYLNTQYAGGANAGDRIFFRYSPTGGTISGFDFKGHDIDNTTGSTEQGFTEARTGDAMLTYTTVPEPASIAWIGLSAISLGFRSLPAGRLTNSWRADR